MALNTQPLTPVRRVVMLGVLLGCFLGSLGLAETLVYWRARQGGGQGAESGRDRGEAGAAVISFAIDWPAGFTPVASSAVAPEIKAIRRGKLPGVAGERCISVLLQPVAEVEVSREVTSLDELTAEIYQRYIKAVPESGGMTILGGVPGFEVAGTGIHGRGFARLRVILVAGRVVGLFYMGESTFGRADQALWAQLTGSFKFRAGGMK